MTDTNDKKAQFEAAGQKKRGPLVLIIAVAVVALAAVGGYVLIGQGSGAATLQPVNGVLQVPAAELADGKARFYQVTHAGADFDIFLVRDRSGTIRSAFDTCDVCYKERKGYRQEGNLMVCNNCNQTFPVDRIGLVKGGCNPAPLASQVRDGSVQIRVAALEQGRRYFSVQ